MRTYRHHAYSAVFAALMLLGAPGAAMADCTSPAGVESQTQYDFTGHVLKYCDGTNWITMGGGSSSGSAGYIQFSNGSGGFSNSGTTAGQQLFWDNTNKRLLLGAVSGYFAGGTVTPRVQVNGTGSHGASSMLLASWGNDVNNANLYLTKAKSGTIGTHAAVASGDVTGTIDFGGSDGDEFRTTSRIVSAVSGAVANDVMPGYLAFLTNNGAATPTERMRIDNAGNVGIGTATPQNLLNISSAGGLQIGANTDSYWTSLSTNQLQFNRAGGVSYIRQQAIGGALRFTTSNVTANDTDAMHIAANGNVGIGTTSPATKLDVLSWNMQVGADWATGTARTNATMKGGYMTVPHYTNAQKPMAVIAGMTEVASNSVHIGGYTSAYNAATDVRFYTAANNTTDTGTLRMLITSAGNVGIGATAPAAKLDVNGGIKVGSNAGSCTSTNNGEIRYTSGASPPYNYCNGSAWVPFESGWVVPYTKFTAAKVMSALYHTCTLKSTGALSCWGHNSYGQVSDGTTTTRLMPVAAGASFAGPWSSTSVGTYNTCGIKSSGSSGWCWGYNVNGQIGDGTTTTRNSPTQISGTWIQLDTGGMTASAAAADNGWYTCGVKDDNTGWCWGGNGSGALGDGTTTQRTSPVQVTGNWLGIWPARYGSHTCGIRTDNTLWCWGYNNYGQLGVGNTTDASTPQQVSGTWSSVVAGGAHTCGIKTDNTLWCWGYNTWGALGDGTLTQRTSPVQVSGGGSWSDVAIYSAGTSSPGITYGIKTDGTALSWGYNQYADTKTGSTATHLAVPTALATSAVTSGSQWTDFEGGYYVMCGVRDDSTVHCWGAFNYYNRFGDPNVTTYFNPVGG